MTGMRPFGKAGRITLREWERLKWRDPRADLLAIGLVEAEQGHRGTPILHDDLRCRELREFLYLKQAALFSHCISTAIIKAPVAYAMHEAEDYDCLVRWRGQHFPHARVQLKEVVPHLNPKASIEVELSKLSKYANSSQTIVAMHVNQTGPLVYSDIKAPATGMAEIWLYSSISADQGLWFLYGDLRSARREGYEIPWPTTLR